MILLALVLQMTPAPATACTAVAPPPAGLAAWNAPPSAAPTIGRPAALTLAVAATAGLTVEHMPAPGSFAGRYAFAIDTPGTYRVALSAGAWIDVVDGRGKALESIAHTQGPACSGIRKIVDFALAPGAYTLQLSGAKAPALRVLIVAK